MREDLLEDKRNQRFKIRVKILQNKVIVRKFTENDVPNKVKWINDENNNKYLHYDLPLEIEKTLRWFNSVKDSESRYDAVIEYDGIPVGIIGLLSIEDGKAEYYVAMGEKDYKGKGIAAEASRQIFDCAKSQLGLQTIYLFTEVNNLNAQELFESVGFERKRLDKNSISNRGKLVDRYYYELEL